MQGCVQGFIEKHCRDMSWGVSSGVCKGMGQQGGHVLRPPEQVHRNGICIMHWLHVNSGFLLTHYSSLVTCAHLVWVGHTPASEQLTLLG